MNIVLNKATRWLAGAALLVCTPACSATGAADSGAAVRVVASTDVWADVVAQVAGELTGSRIAVTALISDPSADPHSYEANARNQLAVARADVLLENGGGYDDFVARLRRGATATVIDAVVVSGARAQGGELNEHVWYSADAVRRVVDRITTVLSVQDAADAATFRANAAAFRRELAALSATERSIAAAHRGAGVAVTEPVPLYLLHACGLVDRTPPAFSNAVDQGNDVPARALRATLALISTHSVKLLVYNAQTVGPETVRVRAAAAAHGVPTVVVTETLPAGKSYTDWMRANLAAVAKALR